MFGRLSRHVGGGCSGLWKGVRGRERRERERRKGSGCETHLGFRASWVVYTKKGCGASRLFELLSEEALPKVASRVFSLLVGFFALRNSGFFASLLE